MEKRKLRGGMIGGGIGSFFGPVHRMAATLDGQAEFVCGAFSADPVKSKKSGQELYLAPERVYGDYREMVAKESALPPDKRIDFVSIVTPNVYHFEAAKLCLEAGFHVICDKPMTCNLAEAKALKAIVAKTHKVFALTHTYTGYPMVKQARYLVEQGTLGKINKVVVEYPQGWLAGFLESGVTPATMWRTDPQKAGVSLCMGDIGIHAENLGRYITGLEVEEVCADISHFIPGNPLDDDANILVRYQGGAKGVITASQISTGEENGLNIRVYGAKNGLYWNQENSNYLAIRNPEGYVTTYSKGNKILCPAAQNAARLPPGHPEGIIEALANIYLEAFRAIRDSAAKRRKTAYDFPDVNDGVTGMAFVETALASASSDHKWVKMLSTEE
ncbi:MAG: Gfo/Idh/MocA family oxidoreductase [Dehalococcoidales bacterium]|jgi:predicted dehydrogenase